MTGVSQQKAGRPQSVLFHFRSSYNCCYASGLVVWASVINSGWKPHHLLAGKSIQPVGVDFFPRPGSLLVVVEVEKAFSLCFCRHTFVFSSNDFVFLSPRMKDLITCWEFLSIFQYFHVSPFFPAGRAIYLSLSSVHDWGDDDRRCAQADQWRLFLYRTDYCDRRVLGRGF